MTLPKQAERPQRGKRDRGQNQHRGLEPFEHPDQHERDTQDGEGGPTQQKAEIVLYTSTLVVEHDELDLLGQLRGERGEFSPRSAPPRQARGRGPPCSARADTPRLRSRG